MFVRTFGESHRGEGWLMMKSTTKFIIQQGGCTTQYFILGLIKVANLAMLDVAINIFRKQWPKNFS
ncbi:hypothetical protein KFK09_007131 [Dendrobium nobile]|uniref:Uncharacterized protein n=1 Tax=Dendrobium nobile TaxID=94219 RepID=A0A8T3BUB2_DENNO|nr:hypothetical protein KFK09_007131 [Dendrobium nobile]